MKIIYVYDVELKSEEQSITLPLRRKFLSAQARNGKIGLYYEIESDSLVRENIRVIVIPTGMHFAPNGLEYLGTVKTMIFSDAFLWKEFFWHVYEITRGKDG